MKRTFLIMVCAMALAAGSAHAQGVLVNDPASLIEEVQQLASQVKSYTLQAQQYITQGQQYATEVAQLQAFVHDPSLGAAMGLMNQQGLGNSLPINPSAVASLTNGFNSLTSLSGVLGKLQQLNGLVNTSYNANHVYSPTDGSWNSQQLIANGNAIAGVQGAAQSAYQDLRKHLPILQALRDRLATATTPKDVQDAQAALQSEQAWTSNLQSEVNAIQVNYQAQADARMQRDNESIDRSIDNFLANATTQGRGLTR